MLAAGILAACNNGESTQTGGQTPGGEGIEPARLIFEKTENGYSVTGYEGAPTVVVIPETYEGLPVTSIGAGAFYNCSGLTSVTIPDSVTSIGDYAFVYCDGLTSVTIGDSVTSIGESAFEDCSGLTSVVIPDSVTSIGDHAFRYCTGLTSVTIGDSVTSIGDPVFDGCYKLVEVYNKSSLNIVAGSSAYGYVGYYAKNVYTKEGGSRLTDTADGFRFFYDGAQGYLMGYYGSETDVTLPASFRAYDGTFITKYAIYDYAFSGCTGLMTSITIPDSVTSIGDYAFADCYKLVEVYNKSSLNITAGSEDNGYAGCYARNVYTKEGGSRLTDTADGFRFFYDGAQGYLMGYNGSETDVTLPAFFRAYDGTFITKYAIYDYAFSGCTGLMTSITIPDSVTSIGGAAFLGCTGLTSVTIPDGVTSIDSSAFEGCTGLTSVIIPDSVESIGASAFSYCTGLISVTIGEGVTSMEADVFFGCSSLTSVTIGTGVTSIKYGAFDYCSGLTSIYYTGDIASWLGKSWQGNVMSSGRTLYLDGNKVEGEIIIPDGVTAIPSYAFAYQTGITSITIPDSVTSIGEMAFRDCSSLTSVTIPDGVTSIGDYAFSGCSSLEYNQYNNALYLGNENNPYLVLIKAVDTGVTSCEINGSTRIIHASAFYGCSGLTSVTIPDSVTSIGDYAFYYCIGLTSVTIGEDVTSIGNYAFRNCSSLTSVTIGDSVTSIGESAFEGCSSLTSVTIPDSVTSIGNYAFEGCSSLTSVTFEGTTAEWDAVTKGGYWNYYCPFETVECSDGTVSVEKEQTY